MVERRIPKHSQSTLHLTFIYLLIFSLHLSNSSPPTARIQEKMRQPSHVEQFYIDWEWNSPLGSSSMNPFCYFERSCTPSSEGKCNELRFTQFGFLIPNDSTILSISVMIERSAVQPHSIRDSKLELYVGEHPRGSNLAVSDFWPDEWETATFPTLQQNRLWDAAWSVDDLNRDDFGVGYQSEMLHVDSSALLRCLTVLVTFYLECPMVNNCGGHGICITTDSCKCDRGWVGEMCNESKGEKCEMPLWTHSFFFFFLKTAICTGECGQHGTCVGPEQCRCDEGWDGLKCEQRTVSGETVREQAGGLSTGGWSGIIVSLGIICMLLGFGLFFAFYIAKKKLKPNGDKTENPEEEQQQQQDMEGSSPEAQRRPTSESIVWKKVTSSSDWTSHNSWNSSQELQ